MTPLEVFRWVLVLSFSTVCVAATLWLTVVITLSAFNILKNVFKGKEEIDW